MEYSYQTSKKEKPLYSYSSEVLWRIGFQKVRTEALSKYEKCKKTENVWTG